jgi:hypothetical protein
MFERTHPFRGWAKLCRAAGPDFTLILCEPSPIELNAVSIVGRKISFDDPVA